MVTLYSQGVYLERKGNLMDPPAIAASEWGNGKQREDQGRRRTMTWKILAAHNTAVRENGTPDMAHLKLRFDAMVSPDNNYVNILQTARASGMERFPVPYVLSNCHNTLCAVGGTILEDDHVFGLSAAKKYGGIFVPPYRAVLHQYMREMMAGGGRMILGSDSHTRYGALGTMGIGEGGGELVKQLVGRTYDMDYPQVIALRLSGAPRPGVGPMDVALALVAAVFRKGFVKNKVLEVVGPGIAGLSMEYRMGMDVMTTESAALSSVWCTDEKTRAYLRLHGREEAYRELAPEDGAYYDGMIDMNLSVVEPMIALPFHPSNALPIREFKERMEEILSEVEAEGNRIKGGHGAPFSIMQHIRKDPVTGEKAFYPDQALIGGCAGGLYENILAAADILKAELPEATGRQKDETDLSGQDPDAARGAESVQRDAEKGVGNFSEQVDDQWMRAGTGLSLHMNPASLPVMDAVMSQGIASELAALGVTLRPCICGACFGVTDTPADNQISIRHMTRNYPNRDGSKPTQGQMAGVCLMDARSIAATVRNGGKLTAATELSGVEYRMAVPQFNPDIYRNQVYDGFEKGKPEEALVMGPNIADWPAMPGLKQHLLLKVAGSYPGSVTTDDLMPSGEASSYRSNPMRIREYTMISKDPDYRERAKAVQAVSAAAASSNSLLSYGSVIVSDAIGDGSSREQAASNQKLLGGFANLTNEYATKRYRSNLINWGLVPFRTEEEIKLPVGSLLFAENLTDIIRGGDFPAGSLSAGNVPAGADSGALESAPRILLRVLRDVAVESAEGLVQFAGALAEDSRADFLDAHTARTIPCTLDQMTEEEKEILISGCLMNYYGREICQ